MKHSLNADSIQWLQNWTQDPTTAAALELEDDSHRNNEEYLFLLSQSQLHAQSWKATSTMWSSATRYYKNI